MISFCKKIVKEFYFIAEKSRTKIARKGFLAKTSPHRLIYAGISSLFGYNTFYALHYILDKFLGLGHNIF